MARHSPVYLVTPTRHPTYTVLYYTYSYLQMYGIVRDLIEQCIAQTPDVWEWTDEVRCLLLAACYYLYPTPQARPQPYTTLTLYNPNLP